MCVCLEYWLRARNRRVTQGERVVFTTGFDLILELQLVVLCTGLVEVQAEAGGWWIKVPDQQ